MYGVYEPAEDSYFLSEILKKQIKTKDIKVIDMGSGSGIQSQTLINIGIDPKQITLTDINEKVINYLKQKFSKSKIIKSNLFSNIKGKYDLIIFNPPYLPDNKHNKQKDTSGGKKGSEIINKFLIQAHKYLSKNGKILLLASNLTKEVNFLSYKKRLVATKKLFFEELYVYELWKTK